MKGSQEDLGCGGVCVIWLSLHLHVVVLLLNSDAHLLGGLAQVLVAGEGM